MILTQRVFWRQYNTTDKLDRLLEFWGRHRSLCDEISFFTESDGADYRYVPLDEVSRRAGHIAVAVARAREAGFVPVVNVLNTIGHCDDGGIDAPLVPWRGMMGANGKQAKFCSCPADERFLENVRTKYELYARCGADRYWIDDDVRFHGHDPVDWGCFCDICVKDFGRRIGRDIDRDTALELLRTDVDSRQAWLDRNREVLGNLLGACADGIVRGNSNAEIGFMTVRHTAGGSGDLDEWFGILRKISAHEVWVRPGEGFWNDDEPRGMLAKVYESGRSHDSTPAGVRAMHELENYPFTLGNKSAEITAIEALMVFLGTRLEGIMFDVLDQSGNPLHLYEEWVSRLEQWTEQLAVAASLARETHMVGWQIATSADAFRDSVTTDAARSRLVGRGRAMAIQLAGLPLTPESGFAVGQILDGPAAIGYTKEGLEQLLNAPLIMDGDAASRFLDLGLGFEIGIASASSHNEGVYEQFTSHELNLETKGYLRAITPRYFGETSHALIAAAGTEVLGELKDYNGQTLGASATLFTNSRAQPVAVISHFAWQFMTSEMRMAQLRSLSNRMLGNSAMVTLSSSYNPIALWTRRASESDEDFIVLFNAGFDPADRVVVTSLRGSHAFDAVTLQTGNADIQLNGRTATIQMPGWSVVVLRLAQA